MAKKLTVPAIVTIFNPKGKAENHPRANARDLVNGAGYSWHKKQESNPAALAPFAIPQNTKFAKSKAQEVLDRVGANAAADDDDGEPVFDGVDDGSSTGPIRLPTDEEDDEEEGEEAPVVVAKKPARKPKPKPAPAAAQEPVESIEEE